MDRPPAWGGLYAYCLTTLNWVGGAVACPEALKHYEKPGLVGLMKHFIIRLLNIGLRGSTLVSKFLLVFLLARFLEPAEVGMYGLLTVTISYALYFLGLDFYIFTTREILKARPENRGQLVKSQVGLSLLLYMVFLPLSMGLFAFGLLPWWLAPWFLGLVILEHINQELNRLLVAINHQLIASWVLFFRAGAWALGVVALMALDSRQRSLEVVMLAWLMGGAMAVGLGVFAVTRTGMGGWHRKIDWAWVKRGLITAIPMLVGTLALRGVYTVDRYWFEALVGLDVLGAYVLFIGMCAALLSFMDAAVFTFLYPALIAAHADQNAGEFKAKLRQLTIQTMAFTVIFATVAWVAIGPILEWLGRSVYMENQFLFGWLLLGISLFVLSMVPHYALYALGHDKPIIMSHMTGFLVFVISTWLWGQTTTLLAVPLGLVSTFAYILAIKSWHFYRLTSSGWR